MAKIKVLTEELKIGDKFKLLDEVTRHKGTYKITSPPRFERSNNVDFVFYKAEAVDVKPHEVNCECSDCECPEENPDTEQLFWEGEEILIERD